MTTRAFFILLMVALVLGVSLGAAFAGGFALGRSQGGDTVQGTLAQRPPTGFGGGAEARRTGAEGQESAPGNDPSEEVRRRPGEGSEDGGARPQGSTETNDGSAPAPPAGGQEAFGTIAGFEDGMLVIESPRGQVTGTVTESTIVLKTAAATAEDLAPGMGALITGRPGEDGRVQARSITLVPEAEGFPEDLPIGTGQRRGGGAQLSGTITRVGEGLVTLSNPEDETQAAIGEGTSIQRLEVVSQAELSEGVQVRLAGEPDGEGVLQAAVVILTPEGTQRPSRRGQRNGEQGPASP